MDWNSRYQQKDTPWDKDKPAPVLEYLLQERKILFQNVNHAMVPGCGIGHDAFLLASHGIRTTGVDISSLALQQANQRYHHSLLDWLETDFLSHTQKDHYDMVWEHTCFCAITPEQRDDYVEKMAETLRPGGFLLGIFFIETGMTENQGPPYKASVETIKQHFFNHFSLEYQMQPPTAYPERVGQEHLMLFRRLPSCFDNR